MLNRTQWSMPGTSARQWLKSTLGMGEAAQIELLNANLQSWRSSLAGAALINFVIAWVFSLLAPGAQLWVWAGLGWVAYGTMAGICYWREQTTAHEEAIKFMTIAISSLVLSLVVGVLWASLAWLLPATPGVQLLAALASGMVALGSASASVSTGTLIAVCLPALLIVPSGLMRHAQMPIAAAVAFVMGLMIWRHGVVLHRNMLANIHQRREVESLSRQLGEKHAQLQAAEHERGVMNERQRLLRDMHDGIGASLITALRMIEQGKMGLPETALVVKDCLDDLRMVIDSLEPIENDVVTLLATLRHRLGKRLEQGGIVMQWSVGENIPQLAWLQAPQALLLTRIAQEALANAVKHSRGTVVCVTIEHRAASALGEAVAVRIEDNGVGFDATNVEPGRGLLNMHARAAQLGTRLSVESAPGGGTRVDVLLPLVNAGELHQ